MLKLAAPFLLHKKQLSTHEQALLIKVIRVALGVGRRYEIDLNSRENKLAFVDSEYSNIPLSKGKTINYDQVIEFFVKKTVARDFHMDSLHASFASNIGLLNKVNAPYRHYTLTDDLIRTLVITILGKRSQMMLSEFLEHLANRYHLVIGPNQATQYFMSAPNDPNHLDEQRFIDNLTIFKERLVRLDLAICLSDGYDYVKNPFINSLH